MGQNRVIAGTFKQTVVPVPAGGTSFTTQYGVDMYTVMTVATSSTPTAIALDPNPSDGDCVIIKDGGGHAAANNITITPGTNQTIEGHGEDIVLNQNAAAVQLAFTVELNNTAPNTGAWVVRYILNVAAAPQ